MSLIESVLIVDRLGELFEVSIGVIAFTFFSERSSAFFFLPGDILFVVGGESFVCSVPVIFRSSLSST